MKKYRLLFIGFGTIGRALARQILEKESAIRERYGAAFQTTAVFTRRHGVALDPGGLNMIEVLRLAESGSRIGNLTPEQLPLEEIFRTSKADILLENTPTDRQSGEPAVTHVRAALRNGLHAVTANKGPAAFAYRELRDLACSQDRRFLFEAAVMDGTPVFSLFREALPALRVNGFRAILNSTTN